MIFDAIDAVAGLLTLLVAISGVGLAWWKWNAERQKEKTKAAIICANELERLAVICYAVTRDWGVYEEHEYHGVARGQDLNEPTVRLPEPPDLLSIEQIESLPIETLDAVTALPRIMAAANSQIGIEMEHDQPDFMRGFEVRRILYCGLGIYCSGLAREMRNEIQSKPVTSEMLFLDRNLRHRLPDLLVEWRFSSLRESSRTAERPNSWAAELELLKGDYEAILPDRFGAGWPSNADLKRAVERRNNPTIITRTAEQMYADAPRALVEAEAPLIERFPLRRSSTGSNSETDKTSPH